MRPHAATTRQAVILLLDGIRPDVLERLLDERGLPAIARLFPASDGRVRLLSSAFPSTTGPAHLPFLTGRFPGPCNVPGIRWMDPARYAASWVSPFRFRSYIGPGTFLAGRDLAPGVRTTFDLVPDHANAGGNIRRGLARRRNLTRWARVREPVVSYFTEQWDRLDRVVGGKAAEAVDAGTAFVFAAFYAADSLGHKHGPLADPTVEAYRRIDHALSPLADAVAGVPEERRPLVLLVSDHGQTATASHVDLAALVERAYGRCLAHPAVWHGLLHAHAAVMVSGNAMAHVYLREAGWGTGRLQIDRPSPAASGLLEALLAQPGVDQVWGRTSAGGALVCTRHGRAALARDGESITYDVLCGLDPLGCGQPRATLRSQQWLEATWRSDYPDAPVQALQVLQSPRSGDLVVTARPGWDLRARHEKPPHAGSHGSLHREHMMTPLLSSRPLAGGPARTVDVCPTILQALGVAVPAGLDGRSLWPG